MPKKVKVPTLETRRSGQIPLKHHRESIIICRAPFNANTKKWQAVVKSVDHGPTTSARRIMDTYARDTPGSSIGTDIIADFIRLGNLAFTDSLMRLQPGGKAFKLEDMSMADTEPKTRAAAIMQQEVETPTPDTVVVRKISKPSVLDVFAGLELAISTARLADWTDDMIRVGLERELA